MVRTIVEFDADVDYRVAGQHAGLHRALNTGIDSRNIFLRNSSADNCVYEFIASAFLKRLKLEQYMTVLSLTA